MKLVGEIKREIRPGEGGSVWGTTESGLRVVAHFRWKDNRWELLRLELTEPKQDGSGRPRGISDGQLREVTVENLIEHVRRLAGRTNVKWHPDETAGVAAMAGGKKKRAGGRTKDLLRYAQIAVRIEEIQAEGVRAYARQLAAEFKYSARVAAEKRREARRLGLLGAPEPHYPAGRATPEAHRLVNAQRALNSKIHTEESSPERQAFPAADSG